MSKIVQTIHGFKKKAKTIRAFCKTNRELFNYLIFPLGKKTYIIGTPEYGNIGDNAIAIAQKSFIGGIIGNKKKVKDLTFSEYFKNRKAIRLLIGKKHLICTVGGGNMGNNWPWEEELRTKILSDFPENQKIVFPQTIFFTNDEAGIVAVENSRSFYNSIKNLTIVAREKTSFDIMSDLYKSADIRLTPDIVLSAIADTFGVKNGRRENVLICFRDDMEKQISDEAVKKIKEFVKDNGIEYEITDTSSEIEISKEHRYEKVREKIQEFANSKLVITDRLHGMVFAAITSTPCIVFGNYNQKVKGTYDWIKDLSYIRYVNSADEAVALIPEMMSVTDATFKSIDMNEKFRSLAEVIKKSV